MFEPLLVAALISITDPVGDAAGNGSLQPPTAEVYRNLAPFDLRQVTVTDDPQLTLRIEMGSLSDPFDLPLGFSLPVIEVYLSGAEGGRNQLLSGSGMQLPSGQGWEVAVRLTGEQATAYRVSSGQGGSETSGVETAAAGVTIEGNELLVTTPYPRPDRPRVYAVTGLYDLFGATPWRPLDQQASPWAFSSDSQRLPVVDVLSRGQARQTQAIDTGVLPRPGTVIRSPEPCGWASWRWGSSSPSEESAYASGPGREPILTERPRSMQRRAQRHLLRARFHGKPTRPLRSRPRTPSLPAGRSPGIPRPS